MNKEKKSPLVSWPFPVTVSYASAAPFAFALRGAVASLIAAGLIGTAAPRTSPAGIVNGTSW